MRADQFPVTKWTIVVNAGKDSGAQSQEALASLCKVYWYPLYAFVRRQGYAPEEAQDLTQDFFARLLEKHYVRDCQRERGRFRSFLLASVKHFLANNRDWVRAQRRGGGNVPVSLDSVLQTGENRYGLEPRDNLTPEKIFEKRWALALLDQTLHRLEKAQAGKKEQFDRLKGFLTGDDARIPYGELAASMGMSEGALKVAIHRLRRRFGEVLREEIAQTVSDPDDIADELRHLAAILAG